MISNKYRFVFCKDEDSVNKCLCINGNVCNNFTNYFDVMTNNTRNCNKLIRVPFIKLECRKKSFRFAGATEFNKLPIKIRNASTLNEFTLLFNKNFKIYILLYYIFYSFLLSDSLHLGHLPC